MAVVWPATLPQNDDAIGYDTVEEAEDRLLYTPTTAGPGKLRAKYTKGPARISIPVVYSESQVNTLMDFYHNTLYGGALPFEWKHPRSGADQLFRFQPGVVPAVQLVTPDRYRVTLHLEMIPGL